QYLGLDMAGTFEIALDEALAAAEGSNGLANGRVVQVADLVRLMGDLQSAPTAAERRLDRDRKSVLLRERDDLVRAADRVFGTCDEWRAGSLCDVPRCHLVAEIADRLR